MITLIPGSITGPEGESDLREILVFLGNTNPQRAVRFGQAFYTTLENLVAMPNMGSPRQINDPRLHNLRVWPVKDFKAYLIYYRSFASGDGIEILRVLHHSRDFEFHLTEEQTFTDA